MTTATAALRKDGFTSTRPWVIDLTLADGTVWRSWAYGFKTKKAAIQHCETCGVIIA